MKQTRLLEIIREEISAVLHEGEAEEKAAKAAAIKAIDAKQKALDAEKRDTMKSGALEEDNLEEETLNERPFIDSAFDVTGTSPENLNQDSLQKTIDDAVKVLQQEYPDADVKKLAGELQKVNSAKNLGPNSKLSPEVKSALQKVADVIEKQGQIFGSPSKIDDLMKLAKDPSQIDRLEKLKSKGYTFILGNPQAVTAIEKSLGLKPKNNDSLLADKSKTEKPKAEKPAKEKAPKEKTTAASKAEPMDGEDKEATQNVDSDSTAKELGVTASAADKFANLFNAKTTEEAKKKMQELAKRANSGDQKAKSFFDNEKNSKIIQAYRNAQKVKA
jgi:hypothetical protein